MSAAIAKSVRLKRNRRRRWNSVSRQRYPGQYFDAESGLHYNYFRDYDPSTGRYIESDPIGLRGGLSTYGYALQSPLNRVDPLGLFAVDVHWRITWNALNRAKAGDCVSWSDVRTQAYMYDFEEGSQATHNSHTHAMRMEGQTVEDARSAWSDFIDDQSSACSAKGLGNALHALQDSFAAGHRDFEVWRGGIPSIYHMFRDAFPRRADEEAATAASANLISDWMKRCCKCQ